MREAARRAAKTFGERLIADDTDDLREVVGDAVLVGTPHVFRTDPNETQRFQRYFADALRVQETNVHIVGSAKLGFSLNPDHLFEPFRDRSDIDVGIIDAGLFDSVWKTMLNWHYLIAGRDQWPDREWAKERRRDVWKGWFEPRYWRLNPTDGVALSVHDALKPLRDFATRWFIAFRSLGRYRNPEIAGRVVNGRLYRTQDHLVLYHLHGLKRLRRDLLARVGESQGARRP